MAMEELYEYRQSLVDSYAQFPEALRQAVNALAPDVWHTPFDPEQRTAHQVVAHLRAMERQVYLPIIRQIIAQQEADLTQLDHCSPLEISYRQQEALQEIVDEFAHIRAEELELLGSGSDPQLSLSPRWILSARHPFFGVRTLQWWVEQSLAHAERHLVQLQEFAARKEHF